jgi:hypothetical protein
MRIRDDGNVGINTINPDERLHLNAGSLLVTNGFIKMQQSGGTKNDSAEIRAFGADGFKIFSGRAVTTGTHQAITFATGDNYTSGATRMTIANTGNVGIGTTSPGEKLDVVGNIAVSGTVDGVDVGAFKTSYDTHTHGNILNNGTITTNTAAASGQHLVVTSSGNLIQQSAIELGASTTTFLRNDGTWSTPSTQPHTHGNINNNGTITAAPVAIESGDRIVITNFNNSDLIEKGIGFGTATTTFLRNDGTWATPSGGEIVAILSSDSVRTNSTYTTDLQITDLEANAYYEVDFVGSYYKTSTDSAGFRFGFTVSNTTGTPNIVGDAEVATNTTTGRLASNIYAISSSIVTGSVLASTPETATTTRRHALFKGVLFTGTSIKSLRVQTATSATLTNGAVGLKAGSFLKVRKVN